MYSQILSTSWCCRTWKLLRLVTDSYFYRKYRRFSGARSCTSMKLRYSSCVDGYWVLRLAWRSKLEWVFRQIHDRWWYGGCCNIKEKHNDKSFPASTIRHLQTFTLLALFWCPFPYWLHCFQNSYIFYKISWSYLGRFFLPVKIV